MNRFSPKVKDVISKSRGEALRLGHDYIGTEHLLLGITTDTKNLAVKVLESLDVDTEELRSVIQNSVTKKRSVRANYNVGELPLNKQAEKALKATFLEARMLKDDEVGLQHLILSILKHKNLAAKILQELDVDYDIFKAELEYVSEEIKGQTPSDEYEDEEYNEAEYRRKFKNVKRDYDNSIHTYNYVILSPLS
jgi:ATP-dependent Clp protease ATP-binding subunit ClpC